MSLATPSSRTDYVVVLQFRTKNRNKKNYRKWEGTKEYQSFLWYFWILVHDHYIFMTLWFCTCKVCFLFSVCLFAGLALKKIIWNNRHFIMLKLTPVLFLPFSWIIRIYYFFVVWSISSRFTSIYMSFLFGRLTILFCLLI